MTARAGDDAFVAKYAPDNSLLWVRRMGGDVPAINSNIISEVGRAIEIDGSGNVYITGKFHGSADFGPATLTSAGDADGFVAKLGADGTVLWAKRWGTAIEEEGKGIDLDSSGNVYVLGARTYKTSTSLPGTHSQHGLDILKFTAAGDVSWSKFVATKQIQSFADLATDGAGNTFVAGAFGGTVDFDPGSKSKLVSSGSGTAGFVLKLTSAGNFGWVSPFPGQTANNQTGTSAAYRVAVDGTGNVIVGGRYKGTVDFNPGAGTTTLPAGGGAFIAKLSGGGGLVWAKAIEGDNTIVNPVQVHGLNVDSAGNIYAVGEFDGAADFDPGTGTHLRTAAGSSGHAFVVKLSASGTFGWAETFGNDQGAISTGIAVDAAGAVHLTGRHRGSVDFDPDPLATYELTNPGTHSSTFLVKLSQN